MAKKKEPSTAMLGKRRGLGQVNVAKEARLAAPESEDLDSDSPIGNLDDEGDFAEASSGSEDAPSDDDLPSSQADSEEGQEQGGEDSDAEGDDQEGEDDDDDDDGEDDDLDLDLPPDEFGSSDSMEEGAEDEGGDDDDDSSGDLMADDEEQEEEGDQDARRRSGSQAGPVAAAAGSVGDGGGGSGGGGFTQGAKGASFAKAFAKLVGSKAGTAGEEAPILAKSKSLAQREAEEVAHAVERREAKRARQERRRRGHIKVPRRGEDPEHDQREKQLGRLATRGVVMLFNAIANAQKKVAAGGTAGGAAAAKKPAKLSKASFLAQLKAGGAAAGGGAATVAGSGGVLGVAAAAGATAGAGAPGWKVLQAGFSGLSGGGKMKDWDRKEAGSDEEEGRDLGLGGRAGAAGSDSGSESEGGW